MGQKRYYKIDEKVFVKGIGVMAVIKDLEINPSENVYKVTVEFENGTTNKLNLWDIDKDTREGYSKLPKRQPAGLNQGYYQVRDFHKAFSHPVSSTPVMVEEKRLESRIAWVEEELQELREAEDVVGQADAVIDAMYFLLGTLVEMGVKPNRLFNIVQSANMGKLFPDGKPRYREDGKIKKPDNWEADFAPEDKLKQEIERQVELTQINKY